MWKRVSCMEGDKINFNQLGMRGDNLYPFN